MRNGKTGAPQMLKKGIEASFPIHRDFRKYLYLKFIWNGDVRLTESPVKNYHFYSSGHNSFYKFITTENKKIIVKSSLTLGDRFSSSPFSRRQMICCTLSPPIPKFKQWRGSNMFSHTWKHKPIGLIYLIYLCRTTIFEKLVALYPIDMVISTVVDGYRINKLRK